MDNMYATAQDVAAGFRTLDADEVTKAEALLAEAAVLIDAYNSAAPAAAKRVVSCRIVRRALGETDCAIPIGATQGTVAAGGYSQSWTVGQGTTGELYLGRTDKKLLGAGNRAGVINRLE